MRVQTISSTGYTGPVGRELVTAPSVSLLDLGAIRQRLRVPFDDEDADLQAFLEVAVQQVEEDLGRRLLPQTWRFWYDAVPSGRVITLPEPARAVVAVKSYVSDDDATGVTLASSEYVLDTVHGRLVVDDATSAWPPSSVRDYRAVSIEATVGYASAAAVPVMLVQAVQLLVQGLFLRGSEPASEAVARERAYKALLAPFRYRMGVA